MNIKLKTVSRPSVCEGFFKRESIKWSPSFRTTLQKTPECRPKFRAGSGTSYFGQRVQISTTPQPHDTIRTQYRPVPPPEQLIGWTVKDTSGRVLGTVQDVSSYGGDEACPEFVRIVNYEPAGVERRPGLEEKHTIPFVPEIFKYADRHKQEVFLKPPKGLLKLGRQQLLLQIIAPKILNFAQMPNKGGEEDSDALLPTRAMPSQKQLEAAGEAKLVRAVISAGGFLHVAQQLGLRPQRRPNGFWDNLENVDEELSLLVAASWVQLQDDDEQQYFYNPISNRTQWHKPEPPAKIPLDDEGTVLLAEDEHDRVMPTRGDLIAAERYDLHNAIVHHGGYQEVAAILDRTSTWPRNTLANSQKDLLRELRSAQQVIFGPNSDQMPTARQLKDAGFTDLKHAIVTAGGFHEVANQAGFVKQRKKKHHWDSIETVIQALRDTLKAGELKTQAGLFPTQAELAAAGKHDLRYGIRLHGSRTLASLMGLTVSPAGKKAAKGKMTPCA